MKKNEKKSLLIGSIFLAVFAVWTVLILTVDLRHSIAGFTILQG